MRAPRFMHQHKFDLAADALLISSGLFALAGSAVLIVVWLFGGFQDASTANSPDLISDSWLAAGLNQAQAAELMGYSLQPGSRGGLQSRTWQALESPTDDRNMQGPVFAMFLLLTGQHPDYALAPKTSETPETPDQRPPESTA